jgi:transcription elongation factor GreA
MSEPGAVGGPPSADTSSRRRGPGAAELLRSVGLLADGPATWGAPVRSNRPGVYIVELPTPLTAAPIDFNAVGRWLERVPAITVDGRTPTGRELAARLHEFWLPDQPIVYIGMSATSIGARVAAFFRTPLGDRRPYAGGYWLKTLSSLDRLRVWWAETDAPEEYEDALIGAFASGVPAAAAARLHDPAVILPFANLQSADGTRREHGVRNSLLTEETTGPVTDAERRSAAGKVASSRSSGVLRSRTALRPATSAALRPARATSSSTKAATGKAPAAPTRLSANGLETLKAELGELTTVARPAIVARIVAARELGDLKENSDYHEARREQSFSEGRVKAIEDLLRNVEIIEKGADEGRARLGSTVVVEGPHGEEETYSIVGSSEANPAAGRISASSPIGAAFLDRSAGDEVEVIVPSGRIRFRIVSVR